MRPNDFAVYLNSNHAICTYSHTGLGVTMYFKSHKDIREIDRTIRPIMVGYGTAKTSCVLIVASEFMEFYAREFGRFTGSKSTNMKGKEFA